MAIRIHANAPFQKQHIKVINLLSLILEFKLFNNAFNVGVVDSRHKTNIDDDVFQNSSSIGASR